MGEKTRGRRLGRLLLMGGDEDPDEQKLRLLPHLVALAGGKRARINVCSAPTGEPVQKARVYRRLFEKIGVAEVFEAAIAERLEADQEKNLEAAERATGIFFTGGDQLRLTSVLAGTEFAECIRERIFGQGLVAGGTSAGAAAMGSVMIIAGQGAGTVCRSDVTVAPGLGYWRDTVIDTHRCWGSGSMKTRRSR